MPGRFIQIEPKTKKTQLSKKSNYSFSNAEAFFNRSEENFYNFREKQPGTKGAFIYIRSKSETCLLSTKLGKGSSGEARIVETEKKELRVYKNRIIKVKGQKAIIKEAATEEAQCAFLVGAAPTEEVLEHNKGCAIIYNYSGQELKEFIKAKKNEVPYFQWIEKDAGEDKNIAKKKAMAQSEAFQFKLAIDLCLEVDRVNQLNVVHRDINPSNITVDGDHIPRLIDFGSAKIASQDADGNLHYNTSECLLYGNMSTLYHLTDKSAPHRHHEAFALLRTLGMVESVERIKIAQLAKIIGKESLASDQCEYVFDDGTIKKYPLLGDLFICARSCNRLILPKEYNAIHIAGILIAIQNNHQFNFDILNPTEAYIKSAVSYLENLVSQYKHDSLDIKKDLIVSFDKKLSNKESCDMSYEEVDDVFDREVSAMLFPFYFGESAGSDKLFTAEI